MYTSCSCRKRSFIRECVRKLRIYPQTHFFFFWCRVTLRQRYKGCAGRRPHLVSRLRPAVFSGPSHDVAPAAPTLAPNPGAHPMRPPLGQIWRSAALGQVSGINTKLAGRRTLELLPSLFPRLFCFSISLFFVYVFGCFCIVRYENSRFRRFFFFLLTLYWCRHLFFFFVLLGFFNY